MKNVKIKYNPFTKTTEVLVDGKMPKANSSLNFGEKRLQEWAGDLSEILISEYKDRNFSIEFMGTLADFEDLKSGLSTKDSEIQIESFNHKCTPSVSETEAEVDEIFEEIKNGPVVQLKDDAIIQAFQKAKDQRFEINVVATMSSGKSTLINALLDHKLMPMAAEATTATIVTVTDTDIDGYRGVAYDNTGKEYAKDDHLTYHKMKEWNADENISTIDIEGRIPCVNSVGMKLVLVDTPGPNNSADERHKAMTYEMLEDSDKSLVLFVMRADSLAVDDEKVFLDYVCDSMKKGGKQSRDRYIFAINKMDVFNPEEESVEAALVKIRENLEKRGIYHPNIFPVSAQAALEARTKPMVQLVLPVYSQFVKHYPSTHYDAYYQFSHLPNLVRTETDRYLNEAANNPDKTEVEYTNIEIHSGIVSIEKAIELYINKYARTIKVYDLVQSFNNRLRELAAIATLEQEIKNDAEKKSQLENSIADIKSKINSGESARQLSSLVEKIDITESVEEDIVACIDNQRTRINKIIFSYKNSSKVVKSEADKQAKEIEKDSKDILEQLSAQIDKILKTTYVTLYKTIVKQYETFVKELGVSINDKVLVINPMDFVAADLADLPTILKKNTKNEEDKSKGHFQNKIIKESYVDTVWDPGWRPTDWFRTKQVIKYHDKTIREWVAVYVDYVNMKEVVNMYIEPIQILLKEAKEVTMEHVATETTRIKDELNTQLKEINSALDKKLTELQSTINDANITAQELETKRKNLEWMNGIISRINKLINF